MRKFLPYILIFIVLTGIFGSVFRAQAQSTTTNNWYHEYNNALTGENTVSGPYSETECKLRADAADIGGNLIRPCQPFDTPPTPTTEEKEAEVKKSEENKKAGKTDFEAALPKCNKGWFNVDLPGCVVQAAYIVLFELPSAILYLIAYLFNATLSITLSSEMFSKGSAFLNEGWKTVRDFSNIFFILVLFYIAVRMILGLAGAEVKKMIMHVVIIALLINFSMFFTKIVIDSSNILALIFYNRITVTHKNPDGSTAGFSPTFDQSKTKVPEKDLSGMVVQAFDPASFIDVRKFVGTDQTLPPGVSLMIIFTACAIFLMAAWAFFIAAISFLGRLIELWILIIFSPFAFMSFVVPKLKSIDYLGWDSWSKRLFSVAFMAPIFMFFMLIIASFTKTELFTGLTNLNTPPKPGSLNLIVNAKILLLVIIPAIIVVTMLKKATEFAKKGGGEFGEMLRKGGAAVGGLALGAATGGVSMLGTATVGRVGAMAAKSGTLKRASQSDNVFARMGSKSLMGLGKLAGKSSFDVRGVKIGGKTLASTTGLNVGEAQTGGWEKRRADKVKKREDRAEELKVGEDEALKQDLNQLEKDKDALFDLYDHEIKALDTRIKEAKDNASDLSTKANAIDTTDATLLAAREAEILRATRMRNTDPRKANALASARAMNVNNVTKVAEKQRLMDETHEQNLAAEELRGHKRSIRTGQANYTVTHRTDASLAVGTTKTVHLTDTETATGRQNNIIRGRSMSDLETTAIPDAKEAIKEENIYRVTRMADRISRPRGRVFRTLRFIGTAGQYNAKANREAASNMRREVRSEGSH